jgi:hypothetical protein
MTQPAACAATAERLAFAEEARASEAVTRIFADYWGDRDLEPAIPEPVYSIASVAAMIGDLVLPTTKHKIALRVPSTHDTPPL